MKNLITAIFLLISFSSIAQEATSKPACLNICDKQFLYHLNDNTEVFFDKSNTLVTQETKDVIADIFKKLSEKSITQKVDILITSYGYQKDFQLKEATQRALAIERYFILYGFPAKKIRTEVQLHTQCVDSSEQCKKNLRKVNINIKKSIE